MSDEISILEYESVGQLLRRWLTAAGIPLALTLLLMAFCYAAAGPTLGLYFGGVAVLTLIGPALVLAETNAWNRAFVADALVSTIALVWLLPVLQADVGFMSWMGSYFLLAAYALAICAMAILLDRIGLAPPLAAAVAVMAGLLWLSWPIWLAPWLGGASGERIVAALVPNHPLFALNGLLREAFPVPWAQHRIAYLLTNIGDDIPYTLPTSILPCLLAHAIAGGILLLASQSFSRRRPPDITPS